MADELTQLRWPLAGFVALSSVLACTKDPSPASAERALASGPAAAAAPDGARVAVAALGRLEPGDGVVDVGAATQETVQRLEVGEGEQAETGQVLAYLESHAEHLAERNVQRALVIEAELRLREATDSGPLEVEAQEANVSRLEKDLAMARSDLQRLQALMSQRMITEQDREHQLTLAQRVEQSLRYAEILHEKKRRETTLGVARAEARLQTARAQLVSAEARLERSIIRAPIDGRILRIFTWPGEPVGNRPILQMGETGRMYAVAEVYETDVRSVARGQRAWITSPALGEELTGTVERIGSMIFKNDVLDLDPTADTDTRVVEVRVRLDASGLAARFIHLQVDVEISTDSEGARPGE
jgi:HlyD family secretion protein